MSILARLLRRSWRGGLAVAPGKAGETGTETNQEEAAGTKREVEEWEPRASPGRKRARRHGHTLPLRVRVQKLEEKPPNLTGHRDLDEDQAETPVQPDLGLLSSSQPLPLWKNQPALHFRQALWGVGVACHLYRVIYF